MSTQRAAAGRRRPGVPAGGAVNILVRLGKFLFPLLISMVLILVIWTLFLKAYPEVGPRIGKQPIDIWRYLFTAPASGTAREVIFGNLQTTLRDAALGFGAGMIAALVVAAVFVLYASVERTFLPVAVLLRSVPLVVMAPLFALVFGRGLVGVTVLTGIVVFFPALVLIMSGLRGAPRQAQELVAAYGGNRWTALRMVAIPAALPSVFAAARLSVPGALAGALVGEWLISGDGLGASLIRAIPTFKYSELWASIMVVTVVSIVLYAVVGVFEQLVLARFGPAAR